MHYHKLGYLFERDGGSVRSDALLNGPDEALSFRDMFLFGYTVHVMPLPFFVSLHFPHQHLAQACQTQVLPDNLSLEIWSTTKRFATSSQVNMSRCIKKINPET